MIHLNRFYASFASAYFDDIVKVVNEDLTVTDLACVGCLLHGSNGFFCPFVGGYNDLKFDIADQFKVNINTSDIFHSASLMTAAHYLMNGNALYLYFVQCVLYLLVFFGTHDCFYHFH